MLIATEFILFLIYTSLIFFIKSKILLLAVFLINMFLMAILKINLKNTCKFIFKILPFIIFTAVLNVLFGSLEHGIYIGIRLILVCQITYIFSKKMTPRKIRLRSRKDVISA